jgi:hypothetical protein
MWTLIGLIGAAGVAAAVIWFAWPERRTHHNEFRRKTGPATSAGMIGSDSGAIGPSGGTDAGGCGGDGGGGGGAC